MFFTKEDESTVRFHLEYNRTSSTCRRKSDSEPQGEHMLCRVFFAWLSTIIFNRSVMFIQISLQVTQNHVMDMYNGLLRK